MRPRAVTHVEIRPSGCFALILSLPYLAAVLAVASVGAPAWFTVPACAAAAACAWRPLRTLALRNSGDACDALRLADDGRCRCRLRRGIEVAGSLQQGWLASPWLVVLTIALDEGGSLDVVLTPLQVEADALRGLRVMLALHG